MTCPTGQNVINRRIHPAEKTEKNIRPKGGTNNKSMKYVQSNHQLEVLPLQADRLLCKHH